MEKFKSYTLGQLDKIPQLSGLSEEQIEEIKIVSSIYPFKTNNYVLEKLIDWNNIPDDPIFRLNFPHKEMLLTEDFEQLKQIRATGTDEEIKEVIYNIRMRLNPHPAGQVDLNSAYINDDKLEGIQHKYRDILLFFPSQSQTCHAYCTFCFRWPQFINDLDFKIQSKEIGPLLEYLHENPQISEVLFTGGDPMIMNSRVLDSYIEPLLKVDSIKTIRIGTKALSYWPYKFTTDEDAEGMLNVLAKVTKAGKHLGFMAHFNHPVELEPPVVKEAIDNLIKIGATIRTQSPLLRFINNSPETWTKMWEKQVQLNCIPYYMFLPRDTGAQHYFAETLERAHEIYTEAIRNCTGLASTAKGPVMSMTHGKVEILGVKDDLYTLRYVKHRDDSKTFKVFTAQSISPKPMWIGDLQEIKSEIMNY
ncbi:lysine 2,3-aminomutase [Flavobacterium circumlabens]|uniref:KamA family protein n=1 Tax=Flavobacterium circumlabens TaxID=2133765 RepID=A0A4Y7U9C3_9FLAO|nr:lysine 2,3-aminomutase [Flavobacterium circumlabens]TCN53021.1 KamA family protein [Flavobacterium circumlabens]TEB42419.1 lysine 2,3-aminomutase [Flavobacterium circumlabens]